MKRFTTEERRRRIGVRHHLAGRAKTDDVAAVARSFIGLHGTDPATVFLSAAARMKKPTVGAIMSLVILVCWFWPTISPDYDTPRRQP